MLKWLFKSKEPTCQHEWILIDKYRGTNGFGLVGYRKVYQCKKCLELRAVDYYP